MPNRAEYVASARKYLGTRWVHQGRAAAGLDCIGLVVRAATDIGLPVIDRKGYKRASDTIEFLQHVRGQTNFLSEPVPGALGMFKEAHYPCHTGIFAERDGILTVIHARLSVGKVIEEPFIGELVQKLTEVRMIKGLDD